MAHAFYPFVDNDGDEHSAQTPEGELTVRYPARIAVYDDLSSAPRVVVVEPQDVRPYLEEITETVTSLAKQQGGTIPFTVIREIVENYIHAYFIEPTISILDSGNTIRFADQGPGIQDKDLAMEFGTTSATKEMKHFIRGTGAGLPLVQEYMEEHNGSLRVEDNISAGTIVTISTRPAVSDEDEAEAGEESLAAAPQAPMMTAMAGQVAPTSQQPAAAYPAAQQQMAPYPAGQGYQVPPAQQMAWAPAPQQQYVQQGAQQGMYAPQQAQPYMPQPQPQQQVPPQGYITLTARGELILSYLSQHESVGPTELKNLYGSSAPTWSRELKTLETAGLIYKNGQKRFLTNAGRQFLAERSGQ